MKARAATVQLAVTPTVGVTKSTSSQMTDAQGTATFSVSSIKAEQKHISVKDSLGVFGDTNVTFVAGPASNSTSSLTAQPSSLPNDGGPLTPTIKQ